MTKALTRLNGKSKQELKNELGYVELHQLSKPNCKTITI